jgi:hypothetical protein
MSPRQTFHPRHQEQVEWLRHWSHLLDSRFQVPGTGFRFGLDPILGLVPGLGDAVTPLFSSLVILQGVRMGIPRVVQARMVLNVFIDMIVGFVPFVGDLFDFAWRSNTRNLQLLERHAYEVVAPTRGDWLFVGGVLTVLALSVIVPILALVWIINVLEALRA